MLGGSLEENVLTALVYSDTLAPHIAVTVRSGDFSIQTYKKIAAAGLEFLEQQHQPAKYHIGDLLESEIKRGPDGRFMQEVLHQMATLAPSLNEDYVRGTLDRFVETQRLINAVNNASELLHEGDLERAREVLRAPNLVMKEEPGIWLRNSTEWLKFLDRDDNDEVFSSGIDILDERGVRPARGELMCLLAATNMGKSWFLVNVGKHNVIGHRNKVLHITLENSLDMTLQRYTQSFLALTQYEAMTLDLGGFGRYREPAVRRRDPEQVRWTPHAGPQEFQSIRDIGRSDLLSRLAPYQARGDLLVKHFPTGTLTLGMLSAYLDMLEQTENWKPDILLLDYLTLMHLDARDLRISIGQLGRNLRGLGEIRNCAVVTVLQANREALGRRWISGGHTAEDWSLVGTADIFLTYNQTPFEKELHIARIAVDKVRNAPAKWNAYITQAYEIGQFCLDSVYASAAVSEQMSEHSE